MMLAAVLCLTVTVHDGDSLRCNGEAIRIENIDAPELPGSPKCSPRRRYAWCDYPMGFQSRDALRTFVRQGRVTIVRSGYDRYGRTLARVTVNGRDAGSYLIGIGLAKPWR